jgi:hypothetical protein
MSFFRRMNGWQRSWLIATVLGFVCLGLIYPLSVVYGGNPGERAYREVLVKELSSDKCLPYITQPIADLLAPPTSLSGVDCSAIYFSRRASSRDTLPYSLDVYDAQASARKLGNLYPLVAIYSCLALFVSALLYLFGLVTVWITHGFRKTA